MNCACCRPCITRRDGRAADRGGLENHFRVFAVKAHASGLDLSILPAPDASGKFGYVDAATGRTLIAPRYADADFFYDGVAIVTQDYPDHAYDAKTVYDEQIVRVVPKGHGLINRSGHELAPPLFDEVRRANTNMYSPREGVFIPRLFLLSSGEDQVVYNPDTGVEIVLPRYAAIRFTEDGGVFCDGVYYAPDGKRHAPPPNCEIAYREPETGMFLVRNKKETLKQEGVMRPDGTLLVPVKYDDVEAVPKAGLWLASHLDATVKGRVVAAVLAGRDMNISEKADPLTVDVYDRTGKEYRITK